MEVCFVKTPSGSLVPMDDAEAEKTRRWKAGGVVRGEFVLMRNGPFHRKMFSLLQVAYEAFCESVGGGVEHKGELVKPSFDVFREDLVIMAGHYEVSVGIDGSVRVKAKSLSFANCDQERFERIYSDVINAALKHVYKGATDERTLRSTVDRILQYA